MSSFVPSVKYRNRYLDAVLGSGDPVTVTAHIFTDDPTDPDAPGVELGPDGGYAPLTLANNATNFPPAADEKTSADMTWTFTGPTSDEGNWIVLSDGTDMIHGGPTSSPVNPPSSGGTFTDALSMVLPDTP